jgi:hypothetical protein
VSHSLSNRQPRKSKVMDGSTKVVLHQFLTNFHVRGASLNLDKIMSLVFINTYECAMSSSSISSVCSLGYAPGQPTTAPGLPDIQY